MYFSVWHLIPLVFTNFVNAVGVSIVCFVERHVIRHDLGISAKHLVHQVGLAFFVGTMHLLLVSRPAVSRPADNAHSQTAEKLDLGKSFISLKFKVFGQTLRGHETRSLTSPFCLASLRQNVRSANLRQSEAATAIC